MANSKKNSVPATSVVDLRDAEDVLLLDEETLDPGMYYRFVHTRPQRMAKMKRRGYRLVSREGDGVKTILGEEDQKGDDAIRVGDTVLMCCPRELHKARGAYLRKLADQRLAGPERQFLKRAGDSKVKTITDYEGKE